MQLFRSVITPGDPYQLLLEAVAAAARSSEPVASCECGGYVFCDGVPKPAARRGPVWVELRCSSCRRDWALPNGRLAEPYKRPSGGAARPTARHRHAA